MFHRCFNCLGSDMRERKCPSPASLQLQALVLRDERETPAFHAIGLSPPLGYALAASPRTPRPAGLALFLQLLGHNPPPASRSTLTVLGSG